MSVLVIDTGVSSIRFRLEIVICCCFARPPSSMTPFVVAAFCVDSWGPRTENAPISSIGTRGLEFKTDRQSLVIGLAKATKLDNLTHRRASFNYLSYSGNWPG